jgi:hypothetical protein
MDTLLHVPLPTREWTEKCLIAYVVILTRSKASDSIQISCFQGVIEALKDRGYPSVSGNAAQAIVIVLYGVSLYQEEELANSINSAFGNCQVKGYSGMTTNLQWLGFTFALIPCFSLPAMTRPRSQFKCECTQWLYLESFSLNVL